MNQPIDIEAWRKDGERLWGSIQETKLVVIPWNNPWRRFAILGAAILVAACVAAFTMRNQYVFAFAAISLPFLYTALKYFRIGAQTGGLYSFFSENGFGIGCDADRLLIPYSAILLSDRVSPSTVNDNYIVLPAKPETTGVVIERPNGEDSQWDGTPYKRGIASVFITDGDLRVGAYPNEMIVHLFCAIYPLSIFLTSRDGKPSADAPPAKS